MKFLGVVVLMGRSVEKGAMDGFYDEEGETRENSGLLPAELVFEHKHGTYSKYAVQLPVISTIRQLKRDMAPRFKVPAERQAWYYKSKLLDNNTLLQHTNIRPEDKILVKEIEETPSASAQVQFPEEFPRREYFAVEAGDPMGASALAPSGDDRTYDFPRSKDDRK